MPQDRPVLLPEESEDDYYTPAELRQRLPEVTMACLAADIPAADVLALVQEAVSRWEHRSQMSRDSA